MNSLINAALIDAPNEVRPHYKITTKGMIYTTDYALKSGQQGQTWHENVDDWIVFSLLATIFGKYMKNMF